MHRLALLLLLVAGACVVKTPAAPSSASPSSAGSAPSASDSPPPRFVEMQSFGDGFCARTENGRLWCWGNIPVASDPGAQASPYEVQAVSRPMPMAGLPELAGFFSTRRLIVGWTAAGDVHALSFDDFRHEGRHIQSVVIGPRPTNGEVVDLSMTEPFTGRVVAGSNGCARTDQNEMICFGGTIGNALRTLKAPTKVSAIGFGGCVVDDQGGVLAIGSRYGGDLFGEHGAPIPSYAVVSSPALTGRVTSVGCSFSERKDGKTVRDACALMEGGEVRCTSKAFTSRLNELREGHGVVSVFAGPFENQCIMRDDGQARCLGTYDYSRKLLKQLPGLDASRGLAMTHNTLCVLGQDGVPKCWGERAYPSLGDGSTAKLEKPVHLESYDGADLISSEGDITCVRTAPLEIRCFGRINYVRVDPAPVPLPEEIDRMVGAYPLCVRGAKSKQWYCRDPYEAFFRGSMPGGFEPLRDGRGKRIGAKVRDIAVSSGTGVMIVLNDDKQMMFEFSGTRQPFRLKPIKWLDWKGYRWLKGPAGAPLPDLRKKASPCALAEHTMTCATGSPDDAQHESKVVASNVVAIQKGGVALTADGDVLHPKIEDKPALGLTRVEGLPTMSAIGEHCGLSTEHQVWCWDSVVYTDAPASRMEPRPVVLP